jgi:DNA-binding Lrp family transcriptional regulator
MPSSAARPTARQREYLVFTKTLTDRWRVPPSFEEIARHFETSAPSVNDMVKTLEARGFLSRVPGAARTLRVLVPDAELCDSASKAAAPGTADVTLAVAVRMASVAIERLVPALRGAGHEPLHRAFGAVAEALDVTLRASGASYEQRTGARETLLRVASIAQGASTEIRPGRKLAWWRRPAR